MIGISLKEWLKLLYENRFNVKTKFIPKIFGLTVLNIVLTPFIMYEKLRYRKNIKNTKIEKDPVFILGHWRSGTTHLHKMLAFDEQFGYITLTETSLPHLFLTGSKMIHLIMKPLTPKKRPTDNVDMFPEMPHEHEFALLFLSMLSPIVMFAFPQNLERYRKFVTLEDASPKQKEEWKKWFLYLLKKLTIKEEGKQLVLKNPLDTCRLKLILDLFPNSKFVHIYRDPYDLYFSTLKLHKHNAGIYAMQNQDYDVEKLILETHVEMYDRYYEDIELIPERNLVDVRFEDLKENPIAELEKIYSNLEIEGIDKLRERVKPYLDSVAGYIPSKYKMSKKEKTRIYSFWNKTIDKWGYEKTPRT
jgi:hypothetical protein